MGPPGTPNNLNSSSYLVNLKVLYVSQYFKSASVVSEVKVCYESILCVKRRVVGVVVL